MKQCLSTIISITVILVSIYVRPTAVQNVQQVQGASSFFQQPPQQPIQQTSFFSQQGSSNLQVISTKYNKSQLSLLLHGIY